MCAVLLLLGSPAKVSVIIKILHTLRELHCILQMPDSVSFSEMKIPQSKVIIPETTKNDTSLDSPRDRGGTIQ